MKQMRVDDERIYDQLTKKAEKAKKCLNKKGYSPDEIEDEIDHIAKYTTRLKELTPSQSAFLKDLDSCLTGKTVAKKAKPKKQLKLFGVKGCGCNS